MKKYFFTCAILFSISSICYADQAVLANGFSRAVPANSNEALPQDGSPAVPANGYSRAVPANSNEALPLDGSQAVPANGYSRAAPMNSSEAVPQDGSPAVPAEALSYEGPAVPKENNRAPANVRQSDNTEFTAE